MYTLQGECCARTLRAAITLGSAWCTLNLVLASSAHATSFSGGYQSTHIKVVDHAGPIYVWDEYTGIANNGLPTR